MKPELRQIVVVARPGVDAADVELPIARINGSLNRNPISHFPAESLCDSRTGDCALSVFKERLPLIVRNYEFRKHHALIFRIDCKLRKKVLFVLIHAAKPVVVRDGFHAGDAQDLVAIGIRQRLNDRRFVNHVQPVRARHVYTLVERAVHNHKQPEQEQRHNERADRQSRPQLLPE